MLVRNGREFCRRPTRVGMNVLWRTLLVKGGARDLLLVFDLQREWTGVAPYFSSHRERGGCLLLCFVIIFIDVVQVGGYILWNWQCLLVAQLRVKRRDKTSRYMRRGCCIVLIVPYHTIISFSVFHWAVVDAQREQFSINGVVLLGLVALRWTIGGMCYYGGLNTPWVYPTHHVHVTRFGDDQPGKLHKKKWMEMNV